MANLFNALVIIGRVSEIKECELNDNEINGNISKKVMFTVTTTQMNYKTNEEEKNTNKVVAYNRQAEIILKYIRDNDLVCVEGKLTYNKYNNVNSVESIIAQRIVFLNKNRDRQNINKQKEECDV